MKLKLKLKHIFLIIALSFFTLFVINFLTPKEIQARPGGGHSYSGGGSSRSSSSSSSSSSYSSGGGSSYSGSGGGSFTWAGMLIFMALAGVGYVADKAMKKRKETLRISSAISLEAKLKQKEVVYDNLKELKQTDPNFSETLFLDFASSIYTKYKSWLGKKEFKNLSPFLLPSDIEYSQAYPEENSEIVIGSISITKVKLTPETQNIIVNIDANFTAKIKNGESFRFEVAESWQFSRKAGVVSSEPDKMRELSCPSCGANANFSDAGNCESCGNFIKNGEMQWYVSAHKIQKSNSFETQGLAHYAFESGTNDRTICQPDFFRTHRGEFAEKHNVNWDEWRKAFKSKVVAEYFKNIYTAWSDNNLDSIRNLLSDRLYTSFMFWINAYKEAGLTNKLERLYVSEMEIVKIDTDKFYEALTVRIHASCLDYVVNKEGDIVGGYSKKNRYFSEYWTFIRRNGVKKDDYNYSTCPNCGAPADKMGQAGICEYCNTKISNGDFSWVLSIITQDEVYKG